MLPARPDAVVVRRVVDAAEDEVVDAITVFAEQHKLEVDRRHDGLGLLFVASSSGALFARGDTLQVVIFPEAGGHDVEFVAALRGALRSQGD